MDYTAEYQVLTSEFHPYEINRGEVIGIRKDIQKGGAVFPKKLEEAKQFTAISDEEAIEIAQYVAYHMVKVVNPHKFSGESVEFSEVLITKLIEKDSGKEIDIPVPGNHFADSAVRKWLRGHGEDHYVEIVGINSDLLVCYDFLTQKGKRKSEPDLTKVTPELKLFFEKYLPMVNRKRDLDFFPADSTVVMPRYLEERIKSKT